eukprot:maker-scaffold_35-snap-gene-0.35-mRNA-1 protein AED:0.01 eAED:0.01 QI:61/1/1/1/1/1/2/45/441
MTPIVLVTGFLSPSHPGMLRAYWGEAASLSEEGSPIIIPQVSSMGSAHDRSCEIFAQLLGLRVDFGEKHSTCFKHNRYGKDYSNQAQHSQWSKESPVHLIGHSFGGNTVRYFVYLVSIDFWKIGTCTKWIKSVTTLSSPIKGTLLTYALGAEDKIAQRWIESANVKEEEKDSHVKYLSPGFFLGMFAHFSTVFSNSFTKKLYDAGLDHFNLKEDGVSGFLHALKGGENGGGTPPVCRRDNAAFDLSMEQAHVHYNLYKKHVNHVESNLREFHFIATRNKNYSLKDSKNIFQEHQKLNPSSSRMYSSVIVLRDIATSWLTSKINKHAVDENFDKVPFFTSLGLEKRLLNSDGLCSGFSQHCHDSIQLDLESIDSVSISSELAAEEHECDMDLMAKSRKMVDAGIHRIELEDKNHFSIVPFPDNFVQQKKFFINLFNMLRTLD